MPSRSDKDDVSGPAPDGDLRLSPDDGLDRDRALQRAAGQERKSLPLSEGDRRRIEQLRRRPPRFTIAEALLVTTVICIGLAGASWFPPGVFAGLCGFIALAAVLALQFFPHASRTFRFCLWCLVSVYLIATGVSLAGLAAK
jgi:hypothetical protein